MSTTLSVAPPAALFIGGEWIQTEAQMPVLLPYDGTEFASVGRADAKHVASAVQAARRGAKAMACLSNGERADLLWRIHELLKRDNAEFARLLASETGKPIKEARGEAERCLQTVIAAAEEARRLAGEVVPMDAAPIGKGRLAMTLREPVGVIAAITPFNVPLNLTLHKLAPALAGGNAVVHKPAATTPLSALRLAKTLEEAGAPAGAYNVVTGDGAMIGRQLVADPAVAMVTFTGSVPVGAAIRASAGLKKVTLELGSNSAVILEPDCDLSLAVSRCIMGAFAHSGQLCISVQRVFVHEAIATAFVDELVAAAEKLQIGHPYEESTDVSSLISEQEAIRVEHWIQNAVASGAKLVTGGKRNYATVTPAIVTQVDPRAELSCAEVFGPVVAVNTYQELDSAIEAVNDSDYGLQAGIFTRDLERAFQTARRLEVGGVLINDVPTFRADHMPYGGVKQSGTGREGPRYAIEEMTELKLICWKS